MADLLQTSTQPYIRMSQSGACHLQIAHKMIGTEERKGIDTHMALNMGKALEPVINDELRHHGLELAFIDDEQLEIAAQDPYRTGHPDGFVYLPQGAKIDAWLQRRLPFDAITRLLAGELFLLEDKTMNDDSWRAFKLRGLSSTSLLSHYIDQANSYLCTVGDPNNDELWESDAYRTFLRDHDFDRPRAALFVGLNTANKQFHFDIFNRDIPAWLALSADLEKIPEALHNGELPAPTKSGKDPDCFFCPFAYLCPLIERTNAITPDMITDLGLDGLLQPTDAARTSVIAELAQQYLEAHSMELSGKATKTRIKEEMLELMQVGDTEHAGQYRVKLGFAKGRMMIDENSLQVLANELGFTIPRRQLADSSRLYITPLYGSLDKDPDAGVD